MYSFLDDNHLIYNRQFGFRSNYSTNHVLIIITEHIKKSLDDGNFVGGVFIDLEKAFDIVNYEILCNKGFRGKIELLIKSFLTNRKQLVSINGFESVNLPLNCGVPQGSTLGPLLYLLYINDFRFSLQHSSSSYLADDMCIIYSSKKFNVLESAINNHLMCHPMALNEDKTKLIIFYSKQRKTNTDNLAIKLNQPILIPCNYVKYLGVYIDKNLSWDIHTQQLSKKRSRANYILSKLRHFAPLSSDFSLLLNILFPLNLWVPSMVHDV